MKVLAFSDFKNNVDTVLNDISADRDIVLITRGKSEPSVVIPFEEYSSIMETLHLSSTPNNLKHMKIAIAECEAMINERKDQSGTDVIQ